MVHHALKTGCVVCLVLLAGCIGVSPASQSDAGTTPPSPATAESTPTPLPTTTESTPTPPPTTTAAPTSPRPTITESTPTPLPTSTESTPTASEEWSLPEYPNSPLQDKTAEENVDNHVRSMGVVGQGSGDGGYPSVELAITANTSMERIDPSEHGTVRGEPYLVAYIDSELVRAGNTSRYDVTGPPVQRSEELGLDENAETTLEIPQAAFEATGTEPGEVTVTVLLLDEDKTWDDIYGHATVTVTYEPSE